MKPGKELDILIAEKIFKLPRSIWRETEDRRDQNGVGIVIIGVEPDPYSTDIKVAWEIINRLHKTTKGVFQLAAPQDEYYNEKWRASFNKKWWREDSPYEYNTEGETAAHAICMAALDWVGNNE